MSDTWADEQFDLLEAAYDEVPIEAKARIERLEERISELARENAELKQVPRHSEDAPRCPLRVKAFDQPDTCDERCAWLMRMNNTEQYRMCAASLIARRLAYGEWMPVNYWNEVD